MSEIRILLGGPQVLEFLGQFSATLRGRLAVHPCAPLGIRLDLPEVGNLAAERERRCVITTISRWFCCSSVFAKSADPISECLLKSRDTKSNTTWPRRLRGGGSCGGTLNSVREYFVARSVRCGATRNYRIQQVREEPQLSVWWKSPDANVPNKGKGHEVLHLGRSWRPHEGGQAALLGTGGGAQVLRCSGALVLRGW